MHPPPARRAGRYRGHAIFRVARLHRMLAGQLLRHVGLHPGQELVMMQLWELGPQRQADLVRLLDSDAATMPRTVRRLETSGFVRRRPCPTDKRAAIIEPTPASHALRREVEDLRGRLERLSTTGLSPHQCGEALRALESIETALSAAVASHHQAPGPAR
ncbi:MarR family transcriptional regulator [Streptomyces sp. NPDC051597]|uniref:MarR family winged helix-turn-helix transcriptional regulator n=1 Tax=Streptomyces sp. NPDC051597 TaxID=3155049 RepID=UPI0034213F08